MNNLNGNLLESIVWYHYNIKKSKGIMHAYYTGILEGIYMVILGEDYHPGNLFQNLRNFLLKYDLKIVRGENYKRFSLIERNEG